MQTSHPPLKIRRLQPLCATMCAREMLSMGISWTECEIGRICRMADYPILSEVVPGCCLSESDRL
jgi:hypothetical protein